MAVAAADVVVVALAWLVRSEVSGSSGLLTKSTGEVDFISDRWHGTFQVGEGAPSEEFFVEGERAVSAQARR